MTVDAREVVRIGRTDDCRAYRYRWYCGACGKSNAPVDDLHTRLRLVPCVRCRTENRIPLIR